MLEKSCRTIPYTINNGTIYYLLEKARDDGYCGFPKDLNGRIFSLPCAKGGGTRSVTEGL